MTTDPHTPPVTARTPIKTTIGVLVFLLGVVSGWIGSYVSITHKLSDHETRIARLETIVASDHDLLTRIDVNIITVQRQLDKIAK